MINYLKIFRCYPNTVQLCRNIRTFNTLHHQGTRLILKDFNNSLINNRRQFRLNESKFTNNKIAPDKSVKAKLKTSDIQRLLSLAKPEKWKIAGE